MTTIYICGVEETSNKNDGFVDTEKIIVKLKAMKCKVINPMEMAFADMSWSDTLNNRIEQIKNSHIIYVLPNWRDSIMARIELTVAMDMQLQTIFHPVSNKEIKRLITTLDS